MTSTSTRSRRTPRPAGRRVGRLLVGLALAGAALLGAAPGMVSAASASTTATAITDTAITDTAITDTAITGTAITGTANAAARSAALADPALNHGLAISYTAVCYASHAASIGAACQRALVSDINAARAQEQVRALVLPRGYATLSPARQVFVITNLERVDRGLAPLTGINATLSARARLGAAATLDPTIAGWSLGGEQGLIWTANQVIDSNALEADWLWMYSDGWAGRATTNIDCTGLGSTGCWGHRHNILNTYPGATVLTTGTAAVRKGVFTSYAQLVLAGTGTSPTLGYTWTQALAAGADRH